MKRNLVAATVAFVLGAAASSAFAASPTATVEIKAPITTNTCDFASATPTAVTVAGSDTTTLTANDGPTQRVDIAIQDCLAAGAGVSNPAIHFNASATQVNGMVLVDQSGNTGAGFKLYQDAAGTQQIDPTSGNSAPVTTGTGNLIAPVWVKLTKIGTLAAGTVDAKVDVSVAYP